VPDSGRPKSLSNERLFALKLSLDYNSLVVKNKKSSDPIPETSILLVTIAMPIVALVILLICVSLNQRDGPNSYTNSFDSTFYHQLVAVLLGYFFSFIITVFIFSNRLISLGRKRMPLGVAWLAVTLVFWRFQAMGIKSLDCGGRGFSSQCAHLLPNKLDYTITAVVTGLLILLSIATYFLLRSVQES
jgi:hypothetical protein